VQRGRRERGPVDATAFQLACRPFHVSLAGDAVHTVWVVGLASRLSSLSRVKRSIWESCASISNAKRSILGLRF